MKSKAGNSIKKIMEKLLLYNLNDNTLVLAELNAYDEAFYTLETYIQNVINDLFITTSKEEALWLREQIFRSVPAKASLENRRRALLYRNGITENSYTLKAMSNALEACGISGTIYESMPNGDLLLSVSEFHGFTEDEVKNSANEFMPAHLNWKMDISRYTWNEIEELSETFAQIEEKNRSWKNIEDTKMII